MGYYGHFGDDPTTTDPSGGGPPPDPTSGSSPYPSTLPGSGGSIIPPGVPQLPGSGTTTLPGSAPQLPGASGPGPQPYPGGTASTLPGSGASGMLPLGQPWTTAPVVKALIASPTNGPLFTSPQTTQRAAWIQLVVRQMISMGYFEPGNQAAATGAIAALSQAYGYFMTVGFSDPSAALMGGTGVVSTYAYAAPMSVFLTDAYASVQYWQSTPGYAAALATTSGWINPGGLTAQDIARSAAINAVVAPPAASAASSGNTMLYVGLVGAAGLAAYLAFG